MLRAMDELGTGTHVKQPTNDKPGVETGQAHGHVNKNYKTELKS